MNPRSLVTWIAAVFALSLFFGVSAVAQSPNPPFPVGYIGAYAPGEAGVHAHIRWSIRLPATANPGDFVFFLSQIELQTLVTSTIPVQSEGEVLSSFAIDPWGSRFELWAIETSSFKEYLVDTTVVSPWLPEATLAIYSEDPYSVLPRTRADRPFHVVYSIQGIRNEADAPEVSKGVKLTRHVQSYGATGTGADLNRSHATLISESPITTNGLQDRVFDVNEIPATDLTKVRGEERFSIVSLEGEIPATVITSKSIQIWPVADGSITGISEGQVIGDDLPQIVVQLNDLYPRSDTYVQVYQGSPQLGTTGMVVPGSLIVVDDSVPSNQVLNLSDYGSVFNSDGIWTMEVLTQTPFGTDRIAHVSFTVQRFGTKLEYWRQAHFGSIENYGNGADLNDFDHDGLPNITEFAFGFDPKQNSAGPLPPARISGNNLLIDFSQPADVSGIIYGAEWSTTLLPDSWVPVEDTGESSQHCFSVPIDAKPQLFMRLKVTRED
jgi:hypothetical protein